MGIIKLSENKSSKEERESKADWKVTERSGKWKCKFSENENRGKVALNEEEHEKLAMKENEMGLKMKILICW